MLSGKLFDRVRDAPKPLLIDALSIASYPFVLPPLLDLSVINESYILVRLWLLLPLMLGFSRKLSVNEILDLRDMFIRSLALFTELLALPDTIDEMGSLSPDIVLMVLSSVMILGFVGSWNAIPNASSSGCLSYGACCCCSIGPASDSASIAFLEAEPYFCVANWTSGYIWLGWPRKED